MLAALLATVLLANTALGFQVFSAAPGRPENRAFAIFTWLMALWIVNDLAFWGFHGPDESGRLWANLAFLLATAIQLAFLWFAWVFPSHRPLPKTPILLGAPPVLLAIALVLSGHAIGDVGFTNNTFHIEITTATAYVGSTIYALFILGRIILRQSRKSVSDPRTLLQLDTLALAAWSTWGTTTLCGIILPLLGIPSLLPFLSLGILIGCLIHAYAILNFRLFQPASLLDRLRLFPVTAKLSLSISLASLTTVLLVLLIARLILGPGDWKRTLVFGLVASSLPTMTLIFLIQQLVARPLRTITEAAVRVANGDTGVRVSVGTRDEVAVLASSFNDMVQRLEQDLENLRLLSESLQRSERLATAGALAAGVAHEVNNPLAAVSSLVQLVQARSTNDSDRARLQQALDQMDRVARVLQDLLALARPHPPERRNTSIDDIIDRTLRLLRTDPRFRDISLARASSSPLPNSEVDADRIQQVLLNLLLNARDALSQTPSPSITIDTSSSQNELLIRISDNGPGVPEADRDRIFEPFFTTKGPGAGTGLGLAVCRDIARAHDGRLRYDPLPEGGSAFTLHLPRNPGGPHA